MTHLHEVYKCMKCGNIVELVHASAGTLVCCGEDMRLIKEGVTDAAREKHVPVIEKNADGYKVSVGAVAHPMEDAHFIEWIELIADGCSYKKFPQPGASPTAEFRIDAKTITARAYCNLHGLWKAEL